MPCSNVNMPNSGIGSSQWAMFFLSQRLHRLNGVLEDATLRNPLFAVTLASFSNLCT